MTEYQLLQPPKVTYHLHITEGLVMHCVGKIPNRFHRWTMRVVFGFRIIPVKEKTP